METAGVSLSWQQSDRLFEHWMQQLDRHPALVLEQVVLYRRWAERLEPLDQDDRDVKAVVRDMLAEIAVHAALNLRTD